MLDTVDLGTSLTKEEYVHDLIRYQLQLRALAYQLYVQKRPLILIFEGWDAAGKGGAIKRVTEKLDPRGYEVYSIAAPQGEDRTHQYLWRFWRRLKPPDEKQVLIFDRSWYGRVMVERLEGFCTEEAWKRAYREINEFERQLVDFGTILLKFWVHISKEEQLKRFELRQDTPYKAWKLTSEDWRNREKWEVYAQAVDDMLLKTSTITAPWIVVEGNDKWYARVKTLKTIVDAVSRELEYEFPEPAGKGKKKNARAEKNDETRKKEAKMGAKNKGKEKLKKKPKKDKKKADKVKQIIPIRGGSGGRQEEG